MKSNRVKLWDFVVFGLMYAHFCQYHSAEQSRKARGEVYDQFMKRCNKVSDASCMRCFQPARQEHAILRGKFQTYRQGYIDEHFIRLVQLQDEDTPNFAEEVVTGYFNDSAKLIDNIEQALDSRPHDLFVKLDEYIIQFKGSSSSIGARQVNIGCTELREHCNDRNVTGCMLTLQQIKRDHADLKGKLETYFELVRRARAASF